MIKRTALAGLLSGALAAPVAASTFEGEVTSVWPNTSALCVEIPKKRSKHVSQMCFGLLGLKWQIGTFAGSPLASIATKWDRQPMIFLRDDDNAGLGRPIAAFSPEVQEAFKKISVTNIDLAVNVLPNGGAAAVGFGLLPYAGNLRDAGAPYPGNMPSAYNWDNFFVAMPEGEACAYSKYGDGDPVYLQESVAKTVMTKGFKLANLSACGASFTGLSALNTALRKSCQAWASDAKRKECQATGKVSDASSPERSDESAANGTGQQMGQLGQISPPKRKPKVPPRPAPKPPFSNLDKLLARVDAPDAGTLDNGKAPAAAPTTMVEEVQAITRPAYSIQTSQAPSTDAGSFNIVGEWVDLQSRGGKSAASDNHIVFKKDGTFLDYENDYSNGRVHRGTWKKTGETKIQVTLKRTNDREANILQIDVSAPDQITFGTMKFARRMASDIQNVVGGWTEIDGGLSDDDYKDHQLTIRPDGSTKFEFFWVAYKSRKASEGTIRARGAHRFYVNARLLSDLHFVLKDPNHIELYVKRPNSRNAIFRRDKPRDAMPKNVQKSQSTSAHIKPNKESGDRLEGLLAGIDEPSGGAQKTAEPTKGLEALLSDVEGGYAETVQKQQIAAVNAAAIAEAKRCASLADKFDAKVSRFEYFLKDRPSAFDDGKGGGNCSGLVEDMYQHIDDGSYDPSHYYYSGNTARGYLGRMGGWINNCVRERKSKLSQLKKDVDEIDLAGCEFGGASPKKQLAALAKAVGRGNKAYAKEASKAKKINAAWTEAADNSRNRSWAKFYLELGAKVGDVDDLLSDIGKFDDSALKDYYASKKTRTVTATQPAPSASTRSDNNTASFSYPEVRDIEGQRLMVPGHCLHVSTLAALNACKGSGASAGSGQTNSGIVIDNGDLDVSKLCLGLTGGKKTRCLNETLARRAAERRAKNPPSKSTGGTSAITQ
jgi:hypothetical protein